jgi:hypothetical protein
LADDFSDPTTGWDRTGTAQYRDGRLVVGQSSPAAILVPSPNGFDGPAVVTATGSIDGAGEAGIGLFCAGSIDPTTSAYVAFVDPQRASATIGRLSAAGPQVMAAGKHIDQVVSLDQPFELQLKCARVGGTERLSFAVGGKVIAVGADPDPLEGPVGGLYFEYTKGGTVGIFDDFDLVPMPGA